MFMTSFLIGKLFKHFKRPNVGRWRGELWQLFKMEYYEAKCFHDAEIQL